MHDSQDAAQGGATSAEDGQDRSSEQPELVRPSSRNVSFETATRVPKDASAGLGEHGAQNIYLLDENERGQTSRKDTVLTRRSPGSTPYNERLDHRSQDYSKTTEHYHTLPTVTDFPYQSRNPALHRPNPVSQSDAGPVGNPLLTRRLQLVFLELECAETGLGKLTFELFADAVPRTVENFIRLCEGDPKKEELSFKSCRFHRIIPGFMMVSGDIVNGDGSAGMSIYGPTFPDESFELQHVGPGILTMVNNGPDTNNSQFAILLDRAEWLDGRSVVFGKLVVGYDLLHKTAKKYGSRSGDPVAELYIGNCGVSPGQRGQN